MERRRAFSSSRGMEMVGRETKIEASSSCVAGGGEAQDEARGKEGEEKWKAYREPFARWR